MPSWVCTSSSPARRRARLMSHGAGTRVMPYSESTTTVRPSARASASSGASSASSVGGGAVGAGVVGAVALKVVVEVRDVGRGRGRGWRVRRMCRVASMIQRRRRGSAPGPQKLKSGKVPSAGEFVVQVGRTGVAVGFLAAVGVVDGPRGDRPVGVGAHRVPPADVGHGVAGMARAGGVPQLLAADERVVLAPQQDLAQLAEVPAVADDAVLGGEFAGEERGLRGAGDGGQHRAQRRVGAAVGEGASSGMWASS